MSLLLLVVDTHKWSFGHLAQALKQHAPEGVSVHVMDQSEFRVLGQFPHELLPRFNGVCQFSWVESTQEFPSRNMSTVVASHGLEFPYPPESDDFQAKIATKLRNSEKARRMLNNFNNVLCVSDRLLAATRPHNNKAVRVVCGVDTKLFANTAPPNRDKLVVGWCAQRDGVTKGWAEVLRPLRERLADIVHFQLNTRSAADALNRKEMADWYRGIDLFLSTSCSEGFQMPVLEAAACGRPIIATDVGGATEVVLHGDTGFITPAYRTKDEAMTVVDEFASRIVEYHKNRGLLLHHAEMARKHVEQNFKWEQHAPRWYEAML